jgi:BMFP domain-containing protein YqiC
MALERTEWRLVKERLKQQREAGREQFYRGVAQAEIGAKQVTQHAAWNWFLQILSAHKEIAKEYLAALDAKQRNSFDFSPEALANAQAARLTWATRVSTLEEIMGLPQQIVDDAKKAQEKLEELNRARTQEKSDSAAAS